MQRPRSQQFVEVDVEYSTNPLAAGFTVAAAQQAVRTASELANTTTPEAVESLRQQVNQAWAALLKFCNQYITTKPIMDGILEIDTYRPLRQEMLAQGSPDPTVAAGCLADPRLTDMPTKVQQMKGGPKGWLEPTVKPTGFAAIGLHAGQIQVRDFAKQYQEKFKAIQDALTGYIAARDALAVSKAEQAPAAEIQGRAAPSTSVAVASRGDGDAPAPMSRQRSATPYARAAIEDDFTEMPEVNPQQAQTFLDLMRSYQAERLYEACDIKPDQIPQSSHQEQVFNDFVSKLANVFLPQELALDDAERMNAISSLNQDPQAYFESCLFLLDTHDPSIRDDGSRDMQNFAAAMDLAAARDSVEATWQQLTTALTGRGMAVPPMNTFDQRGFNECLGFLTALESEPQPRPRGGIALPGLAGNRHGLHAPKQDVPAAIAAVKGCLAELSTAAVQAKGLSAVLDVDHLIQGSGAAPAPRS